MGRKKITRKSKGLGDDVEKFTEATGIKKIVEKVIGKDCGCQERKEWLNKTFSYINKEKACMNDEQVQAYELFKQTYLNKNKGTVQIPNDEVKKIISLYNSIYQVNVKGCESCNINTYINRLEKVYNSVKENQ